MNSVDFIIDDIKSFGDDIAIVTDGKEYTYKDLLGEYEKGLTFLENNGIPDNFTISSELIYPNPIIGFEIMFFIAIVHIVILLIKLSLLPKMSLNRYDNVGLESSCIRKKTNNIFIKITLAT